MELIISNIWNVVQSSHHKELKETHICEIVMHTVKFYLCTSLEETQEVQTQDANPLQETIPCSCTTECLLLTVLV